MLVKNMQLVRLRGTTSGAPISGTKSTHAISYHNEAT